MKENQKINNLKEINYAAGQLAAKKFYDMKKMKPKMI